MTTEANPRDTLPRSLGRFVLFDHIGKGGMANIFLARARTEIGAERLAVVKEILPALASDKSFSDMLIAEAKLAADLDHANVVQVFDLGVEDGRLFIAMEYVEGFDLNEFLRRLSRARLTLPIEFALHVVRETLTALSYAHRARNDEGEPLGIVHRDVSPSNVLLSFEGEVKLCDFGIARALTHLHDEAAIERVRIAGKAAYMAPELARGDDIIDARADVYAVGVILWELCAGRRMIKGTEPEMLEQAREGRVPPLPDLGLPHHAELARITAKALAKEPTDRYATADDMRRDVDDYALAIGAMASVISFGGFMTSNFAGEIVAARRLREAATRVTDASPPTSARTPTSVAPSTPASTPPTSTPTSTTTPTSTSTSTPPTSTPTPTSTSTPPTSTPTPTSTSTPTPTPTPPSPTVITFVLILAAVAAWLAYELVLSAS